MRALVPLFVATLLLGAGLLFAVQPLVGKVLLPRLGGTPAVWNGCMLFFQTTLLLGYGWAHLASTRLGPRAQAAGHLGLLGLGLLALPLVTDPPGPAGDAAPLPWLTAWLALHVGLPALAVSATAPLLQGWFARTTHATAGDPYYLYAASNTGSLAALLGYPLVLEPWLALEQQARAWAAGYLALVGATAACAVAAARAGGGAGASPGPTQAPPTPEASPAAVTPDAPAPAPTPAADPGPALPAPAGDLAAAGAPTADAPPAPPADAAPPAAPVPPGGPLRWVLLAAVPSSLVLGVTTHLTTDVSPTPLLWVVPLAIYLLTFVDAFARRPRVPDLVADRALALLAIVTCVVLATESAPAAPVAFALHVALLAAAARALHGALAASRPPPARLTAFYLWVSLGGVLGGACNALVAPLVFDVVAEYPLAILAACALRRPGAGGLPAAPTGWRGDLALGLGVLAFVVGVEDAARRAGLDAGGGPEASEVRLSLATIPAAVVLLRVSRAPRRLAVGLAGLLLAGALIPSPLGAPLLRARSFFGALRVTRSPDGRAHWLVHGGTVHGVQLTGEGERGTARAYYHPHGPLGPAIEAWRARGLPPRVGVVGLGSGAMAAYARPGDAWTFYEVDPLVLRIAEDARLFTYLRDCQAPVAHVLGDARLRLADAPDGAYTLLVLDAFGSDAVPVHLLTREAFALYRDKLAPGGLLALHVSNRYLRLEEVVAAQADALGLAGRWCKDLDAHEAQGKLGSVWAALARDEADLGALATDRRWRPLPADVPAGARWTDARSSMLPLLRR